MSRAWTSREGTLDDFGLFPNDPDLALLVQFLEQLVARPRKGVLDDFRETKNCRCRSRPGGSSPTHRLLTSRQRLRMGHYCWLRNCKTRIGVGHGKVRRLANGTAAFVLGRQGAFLRFALNRCLCWRSLST